MEALWEPTKTLIVVQNSPEEVCETSGLDKDDNPDVFVFFAEVLLELITQDFFPFFLPPPLLFFIFFSFLF